MWSNREKAVQHSFLEKSECLQMFHSYILLEKRIYLQKFMHVFVVQSLYQHHQDGDGHQQEEYEDE